MTQSHCDEDQRSWQHCLCDVVLTDLTGYAELPSYGLFVAPLLAQSENTILPIPQQTAAGA